MNKQYVWALVAVLGLGGCGGGGGGDSDSPGASTGQVTAAQLVGTWVRTTVNYADPMSLGAYEWVKTRRQTIIIEQVSGVLRFRDCISGEFLQAQLSNNTVTFPAQPGLSLNVIDASSITATLIFPESEVELTFSKFSSSTQAVLAEIDATVDLGGQSVDWSQWNQVCVETVVDKYLANTIELRAAGSENGISGTVSMKFETSDYFVPGQYDYPDAGNNVTGAYSVTSLLFNTSGNLSNPQGTMVMIQDSTTDMYFDLLMDSSSSPDSVGLDGVARLQPGWLDGEEE